MSKVAACLFILLFGTCLAKNTENSEANDDQSPPPAIALPTEMPSLVAINTEMLEPNSKEELVSNRRKITYDQRQEGEYNIRADLENFMIVLIPPSPVVGINLLDLLSRSSLNRSNSKKVKKKMQETGKFNKASKAEHQTYLSSIGNMSPRFSEFIEGRTPYKVDISSENDLPRIHVDPQVDVLPPPYPLHLHLVKPYHLEAESVKAQSPPVLPPISEVDGYNVFYSRTAHDTVGDGSNWELKLIGATEQCGPDRRRDRFGICRFVTDIN